MVFGWKISLLYSPSTIQWLKRLSVSFSSQNFSGFSLLDGVCHHTRKQSINKRDHRDKRNGITLRFKYTQLVYYKWIDHLLVSNKRTDVFLERVSTLALSYNVWCMLVDFQMICCLRWKERVRFKANGNIRCDFTLKLTP